ncbi:unnamed protein product [Hymenolepis diminuta]|uniref:Uncharacterized protein n=1 Tax=Hymenolepis diminuta TaxID=6216 RepID=A0A564Z8E3_HYMDI|nr:unnamed protein product [Hymenolepis diminuta]
MDILGTKRPSAQLKFCTTVCFKIEIFQLPFSSPQLNCITFIDISSNMRIWKLKLTWLSEN